MEYHLFSMMTNETPNFHTIVILIPDNEKKYIL